MLAISPLTIAADLDISLAATVAMSAIVFAGSAQFVALGMLAVGSGPLLIIATSIIVNLRHLLYSAWLAPHLASLSIKWHALLSFGLTDEVFAVMTQHYSKEQIDNSYWFFLGTISTLWFFWTLSSTAGHILGSELQSLNEMGLEIAMPVTFGAMVIVMIKDRATFLATFTTCVCAYFARNLPHQLGFILATTLGIICGCIVSTRFLQRKDKK